jgi:hypothetical protein
MKSKELKCNIIVIYAYVHWFPFTCQIHILIKEITYRIDWALLVLTMYGQILILSITCLLILFYLSNTNFKTLPTLT